MKSPYPQDLWDNCKHYWKTWRDAFNCPDKVSDPEYMHFITMKMSDSIIPLKEYYVSRGENFNLIWDQYISEKKLSDMPPPQWENE